MIPIVRQFRINSFINKTESLLSLRSLLVIFRVFLGNNIPQTIFQDESEGCTVDVKVRTVDVMIVVSNGKKEKTRGPGKGGN